MVSVCPDVNPRGRYSTKETLGLLGISRRTLARWVSRGIIRQRYSRTTRRPRYAGSDILALWKAEL